MVNRWIGSLALCSAVFSLATGVPAQERTQPPLRPRDPRARAPHGYGTAPRLSAPPSIGPAQFGVWTPMGPAPVVESDSGASSGKLTGIAVDPTNDNIIYAAAATGGVWKTTDGGLSWTPLMDTQQTLNMGAVAVAPTRAQRIYAGTGEANDSGDAYAGIGIMVSDDGGATWALHGSDIFTALSVFKIAVDPTNYDVAYAATTNRTSPQNGGDLTVPAGIFKTTNGGVDWTNITNTIPNTNAGRPFSDVVIDPHNHNILYAARWIIQGSVTNGIYRSTNAGVDWELLTNAPNDDTTIGRTALAASFNNSTGHTVLYAAMGNISNVVNGNETGQMLYKMVRSDNADVSNPDSVTFTDLTANTRNFGNEQSDFAWVIAVDPSNPGSVYGGGTPGKDANGNDINTVIHSTDSGATWTDLTKVNNVSPHADFHAMAFDSQHRLLGGNDGGIWRFDPGANQWTNLNSNLDTIQFYSIGQSPDPNAPTTAIGGSQDNGTPFATGSTQWTDVTGGDGGVARIGLNNLCYVTLPLEAVNNDGAEVFAASTVGCDRAALKTTSSPAAPNTTNINSPPPIWVDPANTQHVFLGAGNLWESTNHGAANSWTSRGNPAGSASIKSIAVLPDHIIYLSMNDQSVWVSTNGGGSWTASTVAASNPQVYEIDIDPNDSSGQTAVAVVSTRNSVPIYRTTNGGMSWQDISGTTLPHIPAYSAKIDNDAGKTIYVANANGVYSSAAPYSTWARLGTGLPNVITFALDLNLNTNVLAAGTHGRGAWYISTRKVPVTIAQSINPSAIPSGGTATVTLTLTNSNPDAAITSASFTDTMADISATAGNVTGTCAGITPTSLTAGQTSISFSGITVPTAGSCTVIFTVSSTTVGTHTNTTSGVASPGNKTGSGSTANLLIGGPPTIVPGFTAPTMPSGGLSTLSFVLSNPNSFNLTGASFTASLTSSLLATGGAVGSGNGACAGTTPSTVAQFQTTFSFSGITIPANGSCAVYFPVSNSTPGSKTVTASGVSTDQNLTGTGATASVIAVVPIGVSIAFSPSSIISGAPTQVQVTLNNTNSVSLTNAFFSDTLSQMSTVASVVGGSCRPSSPTSLTDGQTNLTFGGITVPPGTCNITFSVTSTTATTVTVTNQVSAVGSDQTALGLASNKANLVVYPPPVLTITKTHSGNFPPGQTGTYSVVVQNTGPTATSGQVMVGESVPPGMTLVSMSGANWSCPALGTTCSRTDSLAAGSSYPTITVTVSVAAGATSPLVNSVSVTGGGAVKATATDSTIIAADTAFWVVTMDNPLGNFTQGQTDAFYRVYVSNAVGKPQTSGLVTVTESVPPGLTLKKMVGTNWTCAAGGNTCTRSDGLAGGSTYPEIDIYVDVAWTATSPQVNNVSVAGGGATGAATASDSTTIIPNPAVLSIAKTHTGNFTQGQNGATYNIVVSNATGTGPTSGTVTVTETVPTGMALVSLSGTGWACPGDNTCSRADALTAGKSYPAITATVNVAFSAAATLVNTASVSGGGSATATANNSTSITPNPPLLSIAKSHTANFTLGQNGATYSIVVSNAAGAGPTTGQVSVTDTVPPGMTLVSLSGNAWTCAGTTCTRTDALSGGSSYPAITATVNIAANAGSPLTNRAAVSGGGSSSANALDATTIFSTVPVLSIAKRHVGAFLQGQNGAYTITVSNAANAAATTGALVTVTEAVPTGMTLVSMSGNGWTCPLNGNTCTRNDPLSTGASYPDITAIVNVSFSAASTLVNGVSVSGGGSVTASTIDSTTISFNPPLLTLAKTHTADFVQGQNGATYTLVVSDSAGSGPTSGMVTVTDTLPPVLALVSMAGNGWTCPGAGGAATCSRSDTLTGGSSYPPITVTVNVARLASSPQVNTATVTGGGSVDGSASDSTNILTNAPALSITKSHAGNFQAGLNGATYTVVVSNAPGALATGGSVVVTETVPPGMTLVSMAGDGWSCNSGSNICARRDALSGGASYPPLTVTVNVAPGATSPQVNSVSVGCCGTPAVTATDSTIIGPTPPTLSISKTHSGSFTQGQSGAAYSITVSNLVNAAATNATVTVTETVPTGMTLTSMSGAGWTCAPGGNTCTRTDALSGGASYPPITALVNVAANAGSPLVNSVSVSGGGSAGSSATDSTVVNINPAVLSIAKSHTGNFTQGQNGAAYTITVSNAAGAGPTTAPVTVTETVPTGMTLVSMAGSGWTCPGGNTCTRSDALAPGASYPSIAATVNVDPSAGSTLSNGASVSGGGSAGASANDSTTIVPPPASLSITNTHTGNFTQGQTGNATITISNAAGAGPTVGTVTVAERPVTTSLRVLSAMSGNGWTCTTTQCTRSDSLAPGASYPPITAPLTVDVFASSPLVNQATVSGGGSASATANDSIAINSAAVLTIASSHGGSILQGQSFQYAVTVTNTGTGATIGDITMTEALPPGLTLVSMSGSGWTCPAGGNTCTTSAVLNPGNNPLILVNVKADLTATSPLVNSVTVSGGGAPSATATDSTVIGVAQPNFSITKSHTGNFTQGQTGASYTITVLNDPNAPVVGLTSGVVTVTDTTPTGMTLASMAGAGWTCAQGGNTCTRSDALYPGSTYPPITATVNLAANAATTLANSASVSGGGGSTRSKSDSTTINPSAPALSIVKSHSGNFTQGQNGATYNIGVSNAAGVGPTSGTVTVTEAVPPGMTLVSMSGTGWTCAPGGNTCTRADVLNGGSSYPAITATVNVDPAAATPLVNIATVSGGGSGTATATDSTNINANAPALAIVKSHVGSFAQGQNGASYTVVVSNAAGAGPTSGTVTVTEAVPTGMTLASMAGTGWVCNAGSCTRADTLAGGGSYPPIGVTVNVAANASSPLVNSVSVSGGGSLGASTTDSTAIGVALPVLSIAKSHSGSFTQGANGTYTLTVSNGVAAGPTSGAVTVTEAVPTGMTLVSMAGTGWTCPGGNTCSRADALSGGASYPSITVTVSVAATATSPQVNSVSVSGGGSASAAATDSTVIGANQTVSVTLQTTPAGLSISADGTAYTAPHTFSWTAGSQHTIAAATQGAGTRYAFSTWSDSGAASHTINAPAAGSSATYTATFSTQYLLTVTALPGNGGSVAANPSSGDGYYAPGTSVQLTAQPATGYSFSGYSGAFNNGINPQTLTMSQPQTVSAAFTAVGVAPSVVSVTPSGGSGAVQNFTAVYNAANGYQDLQWVQMLIAVATDGGGQSYCYVHYDVAGNGLWLYSDQVGFFLGPIAPGSASNRLQGSACALNTSGTSVVKVGTSLTLNVSVVFKAAGARNVYLRAMNLEANDTNWVQRGAWSMTAAALQTPTVSPASGSGTTQTFTLTYPDPPGFAGAAFGWVQFLVAAASNGGGQPFCYVHYDRGGNGLWMYSSDVGYFLGPVSPGTASNALSSSACSINTAGSTVTNTNGNLVVVVPITMKAPMNGAKLLFERTLDVLARDTGWVQTGSWTVQ